MMAATHVAWVNRAADYVSEVERHLARAAELASGRGVRCTLLHEAGTWVEPAFARSFDGCFPIVDLDLQLARLRPDLIYLHRYREPALWRELARVPVPVICFLHDHELFCLRRSKYRTVGARTCGRVASRGACYPCLGFLERRRGPGFPLALRTLSALQADQSVHMGFEATVVGSKYMEDHVLAHGFDPERVHRLPMFVRRPIACDSGASREPRRLLFVGPLVKGEGLDLLLEALRRLPTDLHLDVVGEGPELERYRAQAQRHDLLARVSFLGRLQSDELSARYRRATATVVPSREPKAFGHVGPESLLHGTPVIESRIGGVSEWLQDGVTGIAFRSGEVDSLVSAVQRLLHDPAAALAMAERGRSKCEERFTEERHADALLSLFTELRKAGPTGASHDLAS